MLYIIFSLLLGTLIGWLVRKREPVNYLAQNCMSILVWFLLFFLGVSIGSNKTVISQLKTIGIISFFIFLSATGGSVVMAYLLHKFINKHEK